MRPGLAVCGFLFFALIGGSADGSPASADDHVAPAPVILFDRGHHNYGQNSSQDEPGRIIESFLESHGFEVRGLEGAITRHALAGVAVFHTSNALSAHNIGNWSLPNPSAFTTQEIDVLSGWVRSGGSLLMVIEHMPFGGSYRQLAAAFGIEVSNGFAVGRTRLSGWGEDAVALAGNLLFRRNDETWPEHAVLSGALPYGEIDYLATDCGSAFALPPGATSLLTLDVDTVSLEPSVSWEFTPQTPRREVAGWSQAGILPFGDGKVAVLGDNFLISAPAYLEPPYIEDAAEAVRGAHNHQFTLNVYRWLSQPGRSSARP
jgi:hypothetical protein